ncbi:MAG: DUF3579 domain-containing protein [Brachymonas sp.]|nr:DUF3579 domain-containing protein [Brachymonas sp.]
MDDADLGKEIVILGVTSQGRTFRPSNWAERLAGVMSVYRPQAARPSDYISYSPWCMPSTEDGVKCLVVQPALQKKFPEAWQYVEQFARENDLQVRERVTAH